MDHILIHLMLSFWQRGKINQTLFKLLNNMLSFNKHEESFSQRPSMKFQLPFKRLKNFMYYGTCYVLALIVGFGVVKFFMPKECHGQATCLRLLPSPLYACPNINFGGCRAHTNHTCVGTVSTKDTCHFGCWIGAGYHEGTYDCTPIP